MLQIFRTYRWPSRVVLMLLMVAGGLPLISHACMAAGHEMGMKACCCVAKSDQAIKEHGHKEHSHKEQGHKEHSHAVEEHDHASHTAGHATHTEHKQQRECHKDIPSSAQLLIGQQSSIQQSVCCSQSIEQSNTYYVVRGQSVTVMPVMLALATTYLLPDLDQQTTYLHTIVDLSAPTLKSPALHILFSSFLN